MSKKSKKADNAKLAKGAAKIKKAQKEASKTEPGAEIQIPELTRPVQEIVADRVTVLPGHIGLELAETTPIEESLAILDWAKGMSDHVQFMIGDIIIFGQNKWGETYTAVLNRTGRAYSTLAGYAEAARRIPVNQRQAALSFSHHREILRLPDEKIPTVLQEVGAQAEKGTAPSVMDLRVKVQKLTPRKKKAPKKVTSGKGKKKAKPEPPPYEPSDEESSKLDAAEQAIGEAVDAIKSANLIYIVRKLDNKEKRRWLSMTEPIVVFNKAVYDVTGY